MNWWPKWLIYFPNRGYWPGFNERLFNFDETGAGWYDPGNWSKDLDEENVQDED